jgi:ABC-type dipeptide/oligopeptide/nickel transport system permease component
MKAMFGMAVAVALGVVIASFVNKWINKSSSTTTA